MNPTERMLLHLLDCALAQRTPDATLAEGVDWAELFTLAQAHKIDALLLDTVLALPGDKRPPTGLLSPWQENAMLTTMTQSMLVMELHALLLALAEAGVRAVVLKGVVLKALYPEPDLRTMSDADLLVEKVNVGAALSVFEKEGFAEVSREPGVITLVNPDGLRVELHERLFDQTAYGFLSRLDEEAMFPIARARMEPVYGGEAYVFPPKEHALFMLCHMAKHMITTGFGLRQAADFALFTKANDDTLPWEDFWRDAQRLGLSQFASALLFACVTYLSLPKSRWAKGATDDPPAAEALVFDLLDAGVFGNRTEERRRSAAVVYRAFDAKDGDSGRLRRALFPSATSLKAPYLYARAHRALLPVAWAHRWVNYLWGYTTGRHKGGHLKEGMKIADERLLLLRRLGLRDTDHNP